ncbi:hypothetical protein EJB05_24854, partial [Eragrostis curvula]
MTSGQKNSSANEATAALLEQPAKAPECNHVAGFSWLMVLGFAFLTFNSVMAVYQENAAWGAIAFVASCFIYLVLFFCCLRWYERTAPGSARRERLKIAMWLLATMLFISLLMLLEFWFSTAPQLTAGAQRTSCYIDGCKKFLGAWREFHGDKNQNVSEYKWVSRRWMSGLQKTSICQSRCREVEHCRLKSSSLRCRLTDKYGGTKPHVHAKQAAMQPTTVATPKAMRGILSSREGAPVARGPLLQKQAHDDDAGHGGSFAWLATAAIVCLAFSCGKAVYRSRGDPGALVFVAFPYLDLALLLCCLWWYERAEPGSSLSHRIKAAIWLLTAALTFVFANRVAAVMPAAYAAVVWVVALASAAGGFVSLFCVKPA